MEQDRKTDSLNMFTGLIEATGTITSVEKTGNGIRLSLMPSLEFAVQLGDSVSVNGVCLTVTKHGKNISFDISPETLRSTTIGELRTKDRVNLERALTLSGRLGGHLVTGHVDGVGTISDRRTAGEYTFFTFEAPSEVLKYIVKKGSIAIDGISLTVVEVNNRTFSVAIIPHTLKATNIDGKVPGGKVNLEADIIGKYVEKFLGSKDTDKGLMELLKEKGFAG